MTYAVDIGAALLEIPDQHGLPPYSWRGVCRIPGCRKAANDPHHAVPRGRTGGPVRYVLLDGQLVPNVIGVCAFHHHRVTVGEAWLVYQDMRWHYSSPQRANPEPLLPLDNAGAIRASGGKYCPVCGRAPAPRDAYHHTGPPRQRRDVTVRVPADAENGSEILSSLVEQVGERIGLIDPASPSASYYAMTAALSAVLLEPRMLRDLNGNH